MTVIDSLITDRTFDDARLHTDKGLYRASDLNRVEDAVRYLAGELKRAGYGVTTENGPLWSEKDIPDFQQMERYLRNIEAVRNALPLLPNTPQTPPDMDMLTYSEANNIEMILASAHKVLENIKAAWMYAGELFAGEV